MARHVKRLWDEERTALLDQSELLVEKGKGGPDYFLAWLQEPEMLTCPLCSGKIIKIQDLFSKTYHELIQTGDGSTVVTLEYDFHKFRCLNDACRHIFAKEIRFASRRDNVTYRLESKIAQLVMDGLSYGDISNLFQSAITRQAVGQIFNRWVRKKEELRKTQNPPSSIAIVSGATDKDRYTAILNLDDGIKVYDVLFGVQSADIAAVIRRIGADRIKTILSNCDPTIIETIKDNLPKALHIIPVHYWFKLVSDDFAEYAHDRIKWCSVPDKDALIMRPETELGFRTSNISRLLNERPVIAKPYRNFNDLRALISRRDEMWVFQELADWIESTRYKTGKDCAGIFYSLQSFIGKVFTGIAGSVALVILALYGWIEVQSESFADLAAQGVTQTESALNVLWSLGYLVPMIGYAIAAILLCAFYRLKDKDAALMARCNAGLITREECEAQLSRKY